jgi:hypothetical protein
MFPPLLLTVGVLMVGAIAFWNVIQNWLAELIQRVETDFNIPADGLYSALVVLDRVIVNGQRVVIATARVIFRADETEFVSQEERKQIPIEELPPEVRERLEHGQTATYELSINDLREPNVPTYKLAVRRAE